MEEEIIQPIDKELLKSELTPEKQLRMTNKSHNEIYIVTANDSPNVLKEIGRLREIAFREAGGGTGKSMDLMNSILVTTATSSSSFGIRRLMRLSVVTVISWVKTGSSTRRGSLSLPPVTCSISQTSS